MKNELRYQTLCEMLYSYDAATGNGGAAHVIANPHSWTNNPYQPFYANAAYLLIEALEGMDTRTTDRGTLAAIKRIVKACPKNQPHIDGVIESVNEDGETRFVICDGARLIRLKQDPVSVKHADPEKAMNSKTINGIMNVPKYGAPLELPAVNELKAFIAEKKAKHGSKYNVPYCLGGDIYVNPMFLLDMLQALPGCQAIKPEKAYAPIYFKSEDGDGILLQVRVPKSDAA